MEEIEGTGNMRERQPKRVESPKVSTFNSLKNEMKQSMMQNSKMPNGDESSAFNFSALNSNSNHIQESEEDDEDHIHFNLSSLGTFLAKAVLFILVLSLIVLILDLFFEDIGLREVTIVHSKVCKYVNAFDYSIESWNSLLKQGLK